MRIPLDPFSEVVDERRRWTPQWYSWLLELVASGQMTFPATQNPSSDPNTLDDYEEGFWEPTITFETTPGDLSVVYDAREGIYTKIGRVVHILMTISTTTFTHSTASGSLQITGLPFAATDDMGFPNRGGGLSWQGITKAGYTQMVFAIVAGTTTASLLASGSGVAVSTVTAADMPTGGAVTFRGGMTYFSE